MATTSGLFSLFGVFINSSKLREETCDSNRSTGSFVSGGFELDLILKLNIKNNLYME